MKLKNLSLCNLSRLKKIYFLFVIATFYFIINFMLYWVDKSEIGDDITSSLLNKYPNIALGYNEYTNKIIFPKNSYILNEYDIKGINKSVIPPVLTYIYKNISFPILAQQRQGAFPFIIIKLLSYFSSPYCGVLLYKILFAVLTILFLCGIFYYLKLDTISYIVILLIVNDPVFYINSIAQMTVQQFLLPLILLTILFAVKKRKKTIILSGITLACSFYISFETLWFLPLFFIIFYGYIHLYKKYFFISLFIFLLPKIFLHDYRCLLEESSSFISFKNICTCMIEQILALYYFILNHGVSLLKQYELLSTVNKWKLYLMSIIGIYGFCLFLFPLIRKIFFTDKKIIVNKIYNKLLLSIILMIFIISLTTLKNSKEFLRYLIFIRPLLLTIIAFSIYELSFLINLKYQFIRKWWVILLLFIPFIINFIVFESFASKIVMPFPSSDPKLIKDISKFLKQKKCFYPIISSKFYGVYEFYSNEEITPINFDLLLGENKIFKNLLDLLKYKKQGCLLIDLDISFNNFINQIPKNFQIDIFEKLALKNNIKIYNKTTFKNNPLSKGLFFFEFNEI